MDGRRQSEELFHGLVQIRDLCQDGFAVGVPNDVNNDILPDIDAGSFTGRGTEAGHSLIHYVVCQIVRLPPAIGIDDCAMVLGDWFRHVSWLCAMIVASDEDSGEKQKSNSAKESHWWHVSIGSVQVRPQ